MAALQTVTFQLPDKASKDQEDNDSIKAKRGGKQLSSPPAAFSHYICLCKVCEDEESGTAYEDLDGENSEIWDSAADSDEDAA